MILYLVRHGIAEGVSGKGARVDAERALTEEGREKSRDVAEGLQALDVRPTRIGASPLKRARETAQIIASASLPT
jgi:phosphohistidine phosphatase